jgi:hypothetical protein
MGGGEDPKRLTCPLTPLFVMEEGIPTRLVIVLDARRESVPKQSLDSLGSPTAGKAGRFVPVRERARARGRERWGEEG